MVVLVSVIGCASRAPRASVPCTLTAEQIAVAHEHIDAYLKREFGALSSYYEGTTSDFAVDDGPNCQFHVLTKDAPDGSALLDADIFVYVSKKTLLPVRRENVKW